MFHSTHLPGIYRRRSRNPSRCDTCDRRSGRRPNDLREVMWKGNINSSFNSEIHKERTILDAGFTHTFEHLPEELKLPDVGIAQDSAEIVEERGLNILGLSAWYLRA